MIRGDEGRIGRAQTLDGLGRENFLELALRPSDRQFMPFPHVSLNLFDLARGRLAIPTPLSVDGCTRRAQPAPLQTEGPGKGRMRKCTSDMLEITSWLQKKYRHVYVTAVTARQVPKPGCGATRAERQLTPWRSAAGRQCRWILSTYCVVWGALPIRAPGVPVNTRMTWGGVGVTRRLRGGRYVSSWEF